MGWLIEDRDKYDDAWHIELPVESKLLIDYLHCSCNRAGFLKWSATIASNKTGIAKDRIDGFLKILTGEVDINDYKIYCRKGIIYLHDHISIQQPNGLDVTNTAHIGILKFLFTQIDLFPECLVYFPDDHVAMKKTIENYIKHGGAKNKASAMKSLLRELNRVEPRKIIVSAADQKEFDLLPKETPSIIKECLRMLSAVPGYPFDYDIDRKILIDFLNDYGDKGFLYCLKSKVINWIDKPIAKSSNPRSQLNNWFRCHFVKFPEKEKENERNKRAEGRETLRKKKKDIDKVIDDQQKERKDQEEQIKKENEWLNNHLETKDIPAVMKKMDTDDRKLIIEFINKRREAKGLKPLLGKK